MKDNITTVRYQGNALTNTYSNLQYKHDTLVIPVQVQVLHSKAIACNAERKTSEPSRIIVVQLTLCVVAVGPL